MGRRTNKWIPGTARGTSTPKPGVLMQILFICTANICRSASAQRLLSAELAVRDNLACDCDAVEVVSAGLAAIDGLPGCELAPALQPDAWAKHRSRRLTVEHLEMADLILVATKEHRRAVVPMYPAARDRVYTLLQAGQIAEWLCRPAGSIEVARAKATEPLASWVAELPPTDLRSQVPALPETQAQRWRWLVTEFSAARGMAPLPDSPVLTTESKRRGWRRRSDDKQILDLDPLDLADPHAEGPEVHALVAAQISRATQQLSRVLREVQL